RAPQRQSNGGTGAARSRPPDRSPLPGGFDLRNPRPSRRLPWTSRSGALLRALQIDALRRDGGRRAAIREDRPQAAPTAVSGDRVVGVWIARWREGVKVRLWLHRGYILSGIPRRRMKTDRGSCAESRWFRVVTQAGFEPATSCSGGKRSIQLSYWARRRRIGAVVGRTGLEPVTSAV